MDSSGSRPPRHPASVGAPRQPAKQYALHPLELTLTIIVIALLVFLPWALGGMRPWGQFTALALSSLAFVAALIPRSYDNRYHSGGNLRLYMWPKLLKFPIFWLGLAYFALILCQIFNPAWTFRTSTQGWWMESIPYIQWLPHGVEGTPFAMMNGWRTMMIQGAAWFMVCALWVGITRRKAAKVILTAVALNGLAVAFVIILQRLTATPKLLWLWDPPASYFAAGFVYKNHAGEFLCLIVALCLGLAWWHMTQAQRHLEKSHPGAVWALGALMVLVGQMFTYARAATAISVVYLAVITLTYAVHILFRSRGGPPIIVTAITTLLGVGFMAMAISHMDTDRVWKRFERLLKEDQSISITNRQIAAQATYEMAQDNLIIGHGGGSFRFLFPLYQQNHPEIFTQLAWVKVDRTYKQLPRRMYWEYAHNDYVQFLAEFGWLGVGLGFLGVAFWVAAFWQSALISQWALLIIVGGPLMVAATAAVDFPLHNPAVLITMLTVLALVLRWGQHTRRQNG